MKNCKGCPYRTTKKTKYGTYDWCKQYGCSTSSPKNPCEARYVQLGTGEWVSKKECEKMVQNFADSVLEDFDEVFPDGIK